MGTTLTPAGPGFAYTAVDISMESPAVGRAFIGEVLPDARVRWVNADVRALPFADRSFDAVICFDVL
jgi:ubiquinone/menaquinone biosynthesis C-methylase UbiE